MPPSAVGRKNLLDVKKEHWRPPVYRDRMTYFSKVLDYFYRFLDLQFSTIWRDLSVEIPHAKGDVLDAGCGVQPYRQLFAKDVRYRGIDIAESKDHFGYEAPDTTYYKGKVWPVKSRSFDFVLCTETLEHVDEPLIFLKEAARVLRPGGRIVMTVPFEARWHFVPYDYWRYTPSGLGHLLSGAGFSNIKIYARGNELTVAGYKIMAFIFTLLSPVSSGFFKNIFMRFMGLLCLPVLILAAVAANLSSWKDGTMDCLGYTVRAEKKAGKS